MADLSLLLERLRYPSSGIDNIFVCTLYDLRSEL